MNEFRVYVPSYGRPGKVTTDKVFNDCIVVVPESQEEAYAKHEYANGAVLMTLPDDQDGNVAKKRNWILDYAKSRGEEDVLLVDDDYLYVAYYEDGCQYRADPDRVDHLLAVGFSLCRDIGSVMWGINQLVDRKAYRETTPFSLLAPILGPFQGFVATPCRYDEDLWLKEDYDMWLQSIQKAHHTIRFQGWHYMVNHISLPGGVVSQRTMHEERRQILRLREKWGRGIVNWNELRDSINPKVRSPYRGQ